MPEPIDVPCIDCTATAGAPCYHGPDHAGSEFHRNRVRTALLQSTEPGTCTLCHRPLRRGVRHPGGQVTAWHPDPTHADCPKMPDPQKDWNAYAMAVNLGLAPGEPGLDAFLPDPLTDSAGVPLADDPPGTWDRSDYEGVVPTTGPIPVCPECLAGKHPNCDGTAWDPDADAPTPCRCNHGTHRPLPAAPLPDYIDPMRPPT